VKLVINEDESVALGNWLDERTHPARVTSELSLVETLRACRRSNQLAVAPAQRLMAGIDLVPIARHILEAAILAQPPVLRTQDAIQLATALVLSDQLTAFVAYDQRLLVAAESERLPTFSPGLNRD
jgi:predicted nucleic acid-binding protein